MSATMSAQLDKIVAECSLLGGAEALGGSHRRLPDELVELLVALNDIYDADSARWNGTERKVLKHNMLERLEAAMGQTRDAIRSRMKTAVQRHRRDRFEQQIRQHKQSLQKAAGHDYSDFHHRISTAPLPSASKGNVVVHRSAEGRVERYEYRPRFSLWMDELLALASAVVEAAGVPRGEDGRAIEAEGWKVEKELWDEAAGWWGTGVMTGKLIGDRVKQARKDRRKKKAQLKPTTTSTTTAPATTTAPTASKIAVPAAATAAADKQSKSKDKEKGGEKEKRKRDSGAVTDKDKERKKKARTDSKDTAKDSSKAADKPKAASTKQPKEAGREKDKDGTHKRSVSLSTTAASAPSAAAGGGQPVRASVFYEPPAGAGRWSDVHFPPAITAVKPPVPPGEPATHASPHDMPLSQTQK